jgi:hypothetical protein
MDAFRLVAVALSTVLGLAVARVLSGYVTAFKLRRDIRLDWLPMVFAGVILGEALQFWWALGGLTGRTQWLIADFMLLVSLVVMLYLAAALILPTDIEASSRRDVFERDGRWALLVLAAFHCAAIVAETRLWHQPAWTWPTALTALIAALCAIAALTQRRTVQRAVAMAYCVLTVLGMAMSSPVVLGSAS